MPIVLKKRAPAVAPAPAPDAFDDAATVDLNTIANPHAELIDEIGQHIDTCAKCEAAAEKMLSPVRVQAERLKKLQAVMEEQEGDNAKPIELRSTKFVVTCAKRGESRVMKDGGLERVREIVGEETFAKIIEISLGKLDDYLTKAQRDEVLDTVAGKRPKLKIAAILA